MAPMPRPPTRSSRWVAASLLLAVVGGGLSGPASAHPHLRPPPIQVFVNVKEDDVHLTVQVEDPLLRRFATWDAGSDAPPDEVADAFVGERLDVIVDGEPRTLDVERVIRLFSGTGTHKDGSPIEPSYALRARTPVDKPPQSIAVRWENFDGIAWEKEVVVPLTFSKKYAMRTGNVNPEEPAWIWQADPSAREAAFDPVEEVAWAPRTVAETTPLLAYVLAGLGVLGLGFTFFGVGGLAPVSILLLVASGASFAFDWGERSHERPATLAESLPSDEGAGAIFEQLLRNVYATFEVRRRARIDADEAGLPDEDAWTRGGLLREDEDAIYDLLATTASPGLLATLYQHVFRSLVLEAEGGAVCVVEDLEVDRDALVVSFPPSVDRPRFRVDAKWTLTCVVHHWGHTHRRRNTVEASADIVEIAGLWKFDEVRITSHVRDLLDPPGTPTSGPHVPSASEPR